ncbi:23S rRNA pseudouridine(1911/1915/1917) synthase RluD [Candidatus Nitrosacidococcus sp. I8]|uniref:23S rRNA pseudouridine(1911/1915/1917) synthase RluD n=1 Tax=Candidatus Nitrosacidococcus sp. I8 TaxID=2942908 RepID=UPI002226323D|nr:23S rRNA pseudouridine(1911/1915/1917) synthase RluD [Candidatus Nitrosacidococcus sp. I8]CAH9016640.1 Ribosomal large subunit pseudouridine synthase D [Candidatus Nitrosacidococcus sp. I8]
MKGLIQENTIIPLELEGKRLDQTLAQIFPAYSRTRLQMWLKNGQVKINDTSARPRDIVSGGESVILHAEVETETEWKPQPLPLHIIYEDEALIIINKPANLVVHPAAGNYDGTLVNGLLNYAPELEAIPRAGLIHRLDKDTTGLLVIAKTIPAHTNLVQQLQNYQIHREYRAITTGVITSGGVIRAPIARHPIDRKRMSVNDSGKPAVTYYRVLSRFQSHTYAACFLETGRTHQIRVHLAYINYPLLGDPVYGRRLQIPEKSNEMLTDRLRNFKRQALHAVRLELTHPLNGQNMAWEAPLPEDMKNILTLLKENNNFK